MRLQYASDLHLEFAENKAFIRENPILPEGDILVLAGDVLPFTLIDKYQEFFDYLSDHFQKTYWVPGNHEYYHFDAADKSGTFCENIRGNVHLLNNQIVEHGPARLIFSTLWSKISDHNRWRIQSNMNDFQIIKYNGETFSAEHYNLLHSDSLVFLEDSLNQSSALKKVVISHHIPTYQNYPLKYRGSVLSEAFAVELSPLIERLRPDYWIYGHHHSNVPDFEIGQTKLLTNQLGYVRYGEHSLFTSAKNIML